MEPWYYVESHRTPLSRQSEGIEALPEYFTLDSVQAILPSSARGGYKVAMSFFKSALEDIAADLSTICEAARQSGRTIH